ncbi:transposase [methane-oxidizing endosymbiont of Gigantopelta aegis]|uniref:transposase n=1 Tax=methane-oxidizing endosymbiont of Gigantopelta aegis TaxID=2794938 RepID=UPI001FD8BCB8|nr:transposase [methane-oxidizing endosymbiont of Gigantopelta aegis]
MSKTPFRKDLSIPGLLATARKVFETIPDDMSGTQIPLADHLMSALALFGLKYPSLLQFDQASRQDDATRHNLRTLYGIATAPSDTFMRERLDRVDPACLLPVYRQLFKSLQRGKGLEGFEVFEGHYLLSIDGTGLFSSQKIHCPHCCEKHHRNGQITYYHQLLGAVLVHPEHREVFPLAPEPILKQDGQTKNDCERNAAKRLLAQIRRDHPRLKLIVVEDALASNGPHIKQLEALNYRFILGAKKGDHPYLFEWVDSSETTREWEQIDEHGTRHRFRYHNEVPLNDTHFDLTVNFLEYWETRPNGKTQHFSWVCDLPLNEDNLMPIMRAGRARWRIENETFNTLKNQGYHFEHTMVTATRIWQPY